MTHTPGPWTIEGEHIINPDGKPIAYVEDADIARLIRAAPDLLKALKNAENALTVLAEMEEERGNPIYAAEIKADSKAARAAIAKATA